MEKPFRILGMKIPAFFFSSVNLIARSQDVYIAPEIFYTQDGSLDPDADLGASVVVCGCVPDASVLR